MKNVLNLSDRPNHIRETAIEELGALIAFHVDPVSLTQANVILKMEFDRWKVVGQNYEPSALANLLIKSQQNNIGQRTICGLVALVMCVLDFFEQPMTLERSASIVSEMALQMNKLEFAFLKGSD